MAKKNKKKAKKATSQVGKFVVAMRYDGDYMDFLAGSRKPFDTVGEALQFIADGNGDDFAVEDGNEIMVLAIDSLYTAQTAQLSFKSKK